MWAAVGRMAARTRRLTEIQVIRGKDKVVQAGQAVELEMSTECSMKKEEAT